MTSTIPETSDKQLYFRDQSHFGDSYRATSEIYKIQGTSKINSEMVRNFKLQTEIRINF